MGPKKSKAQYIVLMSAMELREGMSMGERYHTALETAQALGGQLLKEPLGDADHYPEYSYGFDDGSQVFINISGSYFCHESSLSANHSVSGFSPA